MMTWQDPFSDFPICLDSDDDDDRGIYEPTRVCIVAIRELPIVREYNACLQEANTRVLREYHV